MNESQRYLAKCAELDLKENGHFGVDGTIHIYISFFFLLLFLVCRPIENIRLVSAVIYAAHFCVADLQNIFTILFSAMFSD